MCLIIPQCHKQYNYRRVCYFRLFISQNVPLLSYSADMNIGFVLLIVEKYKRQNYDILYLYKCLTNAVIYCVNDTVLMYQVKWRSIPGNITLT